MIPRRKIWPMGRIFHRYTDGVMDGWSTGITRRLMEWQMVMDEWLPMVRKTRMCAMFESIWLVLFYGVKIHGFQLTWGNDSCLSRKVWLATGTTIDQDLHTLFSRRRSLLFGWNMFVVIWASQTAMIECFSNSGSSSCRTQGHLMNWAGIHG